MSNITKLRVLHRDEMQPLVSGHLPKGQRYAVYVSGEVTPRALQHIEQTLAMTREFLIEDATTEDAENRDGDGI